MNEHPTEGDLVHEELTAYLDGELDSSAVLVVERRLADDEAYRRRLKDLQQAWDLLDHLPRSHVDQAFTHTTLKLVTLNAVEEAQNSQTRSSRWRQMAWAAGALCAAVAGGAGYVVVADYLSRPNEQLVRDLPLLENVDLYRHAESLEFLKSLEREGLFAQEVGDAL